MPYFQNVWDNKFFNGKMKGEEDQVRKTATTEYGALNGWGQATRRGPPRTRPIHVPSYAFLNDYLYRQNFQVWFGLFRQAYVVPTQNSRDPHELYTRQIYSSLTPRVRRFAGLCGTHLSNQLLRIFSFFFLFFFFFEKRILIFFLLRAVQCGVRFHESLGPKWLMTNKKSQDSSQSEASRVSLINCLFFKYIPRAKSLSARHVSTYECIPLGPPAFLSCVYRHITPLRHFRIIILIFTQPQYISLFSF